MFCNDITPSQFVVGIDLGGTKTFIALIDKEGTIHESKCFPTNVKATSQVLLREIAETIAEMSKTFSGSIVAIGIGITGQVDPQDGSVIFSPNLGWKNVAVEKELNSLTHLPVAVMNDLCAATMGEWLYGAGKGCDDMVCLFVGTGIGSGVISQGRMLHGFSNAAGEIGHTTIQINGEICNCGNRGCLETLASGWSLAKKAKEAIVKNPLSGEQILEKVKGRVENVTTKTVVESFHENDPLAISLIEEMSQALTVAGINIANGFNPERLILGGGVMKNLPDILTQIEEGIQKYALKAASCRLKVAKAELDETAGVVGAAVFAWKKYEGEK